MNDVRTAAVAIAAALNDPVLMTAALALHDNRLADAEPLLKGRLKSDPFDVAAMRMLAELAARLGRLADSENLLRRALELAPDFGAARANLATVLYRQNRSVEALQELDRLAGGEDEEPGQANLRAAALSKIGGFEEAVGLYRQVLARNPRQAKVWMSLGHMLKTLGRTDEGIHAYREAIAVQPELGEAWWSLANLKTVRFSDADIAAMQATLARERLSDEDRFHLDFAFAKALEDRKEFAAAFRHYDLANRLRAESLDYRPEDTTAFVDQMIALSTPEFFSARAGAGCAADDPIFIIGMPRAGSTLIEQILASHSEVEGTSELPDIPALARRDGAYPASLLRLSPDVLTTLGETYMERTRVQRRLGKRRFIDKLPNNWAHVAFIRLILPNATIIDARRHPMACGFSNFKQHFARGQAFSYSLSHMGRYYADYVRLMAHLDIVLPGHVHRVIHERMLNDTEGEVRALLAACNLDFEPACLRFYETERAVRTASSEQVRRPINRDGAEAWRAFAPWLGPLETALGPVLAAYPEAPQSFR
ncbi:MAG: tetratricopeptide repeat-containing sulfotransferase family protein [Asticcacaulis sp.]|uniref:tetratricopeptide repeat-containing sulfotransferase family protein n=1 Tax=Asticcacaulis sp. TaxID=1872648 RepID=UPI003F7C8AB8